MEGKGLSVDEFGAYFGAKQDTVYKWNSDKTMPAHTSGHLWKFKNDERNGWVGNGRVGEASGEHD